MFSWLKVSGTNDDGEGAKIEGEFGSLGGNGGSNGESELEYSKLVTPWIL